MKKYFKLFYINCNNQTKYYCYSDQINEISKTLQNLTDPKHLNGSVNV